MNTENAFVLIEGLEMVCRDGGWARVPTTILYTGDDQFWEVVFLEAKDPEKTVVVVHA